MKVTELLEAYTPPTRNRKLGFGEKHKIPVGGSREWLKAFGATETHVADALRKVRQLASYRAVMAHDFTDDSTERHAKNGSIMFIGDGYFEAGGKVRTRRLKYTVQPNGKIDATQPNDFHRAPVGTGKPHIVPGDPVMSIVKSMDAALTKLDANLTARRAKEAKMKTKLAKA